MRAIDRKLVRDLWGMRGQAVAIAFIVLAGVTTYVAMRGIMESLQRTLDDYYREYRFADGFATVRRAPLFVGDRLRRVPGVAEVELRVTAPVNLEVPGFGEPVSGLLVSVPEDRQPGLNRLFIRSGRLPAAGREGEVLANESFAEAHDLGAGDELAAIVNGRRRTLTIVGIALSPEHVLQVQPGSLFPDPERFGVLWMGHDALAAAYDMEGAFNDAAFTIGPGAVMDDVLTRVDRILAPYGGTGAFARRDQPSHFFISEEFNQLRMISTLLPIIFLGVAAFLLNVVVTRLVALQREQIGVLKAFGYGNVDVAVHYAKLVMLVALAGAAGGIVLGFWLGSLLGGIYLEFYRFPELQYSADVSVIVSAVVLTAVAALVGVLRATARAARLSPAIAMRPAPPPIYRRTFVERLGLERWLDQPSRMIVRNLERQPVRALLTIIGIASSCAVLIMGLFFSDAFQRVLRIEYGLALSQDVTVTFTSPSSRAAVYEIAALDGVRYAEPARMVPARLRHEHRRYDTTIEGLPSDSRLRRIIDTRLQPIEVPPHGIVLTDRLSELLRARPGDTLIVEVREGARRTRAVPVAAVAQQYVGIAAYMQLDALNRLAGEGQAVTGVLLMTDVRQTDALNAALRDRPRVAGILAQERTIETFQESVERSMLTVTFIMSLFAGVIAFGVVYNAARISLSERDRELASLRVLGLMRGEIAWILLGELAILTLLAIPVGFLLGGTASAGLVEAVETDLYRFPLVLGRSTFGLAALIVLAAAAVSAWIVRHKLWRLDLIAVLKTRQ